ncbi:MAG TPA: hypothetical protein VGM37_07095 [Armatimonadota bacterium]|jgi:hypothetical protein
MIRRNARLFGYLIVLALVALMMFYFDRASRTPEPDPGRQENNLPEIGHVPTPEQVHGK